MISQVWGLDAPFPLPKRIGACPRNSGQLWCPILTGIYNCNPFLPVWKCFPSLSAVSIGHMHKMLMQQPCLLLFSCCFLCCYLRSKQLRISEHPKTRSKKHTIKNVSVLMRQPPFEVLRHSCVLCMCLGIQQYLSVM